MLSTPFKVIFSFSLALCLVSCAPFQIKDVQAPIPGRGIVFGRLELVVDGKPLQWKSLGEKMGSEARILIFPSGSTKVMTYIVKGDGSFYWTLEPGDYTILGFELLKAGRVRGGRIGATFTVSERTKSIYIGNLKVVMEKGRYVVLIEDGYSAAVESFKNRFPKAQEPVKSVALSEGKTGSYRSMRYVCAEDWGIKCTKSYQGVTPLTPDLSSSAFPEIDSLLPTFEWEPSSQDDVSYDLVVYEAVSYSRTPMHIEHMPGRLVAYEEDINEAKFSLKKPLQPKSKYFWSVRLRRNDVVSNWSQFSYFKFYIVAWTSGSGQWFTFATPSK